ncbi:hypothetical protein Adt_45316 [Abeliophyllum distichum]|uniref:Uncharacterized protein n=1 Tax=Abeliophyllum distichum TaxID=126358 RepID=A0ABD1PDC1_9LAMI
MLVMEEKVLRDLEKFEKCAADRDHDKKKVVVEVQSLLDKAIVESKKKDNENAYLQKEVDQLRKKLETADDEAIARYMRKRRVADLAVQKVKVTNHGGVGSQPAGSLDN